MKHSTYSKEERQEVSKRGNIDQDEEEEKGKTVTKMVEFEANKGFEASADELAALNALLGGGKVGGANKVPSIFRPNSPKAPATTKPSNPPTAARP